MAQRDARFPPTLLLGVGPSVAVVREGTRLDISHPHAPDTIFLFTWANAHQRHIQKYISGYSVLYPSACIILVTTTWAEIFFPVKGSQRARIAAITEVVFAATQTLFGDSVRRESRVLVHAFSTEGAFKLCKIARAYSKKVPGDVLPVEAIVLDSAPGQASYMGAVAAIASKLPKQWYLRIPTLVAVCLFLGLAWLLLFFWATLVIKQMRAELLDYNWMKANARRCYIYSKADKITNWKDVEQHARKAELRHWPVRMELFDGSKHVAHARADRRRYWEVIRLFWENRETNQPNENLSLEGQKSEAESSKTRVTVHPVHMGEGSREDSDRMGYELSDLTPAWPSLRRPNMELARWIQEQKRLAIGPRR